ncbi:unnamed protein product, partial [Polarella glacialis]
MERVHLCTKARAFGSVSRLFGEAAPRVRLWRDDAGWCPFCEMVQMVLEEMHVPYEVRTVPLKGYAKSENDEKRRAAFREICPDCLVPAIQLALPPTTTGTTVTRTTPTTTTTTTTTTTPTTTTPTTATTATTATAETQFGPVLDCGRQPGAGSGYDVCRCLAQLFPDKVLLPRTPVRRARAEALASLVVQLECTFLPLLRKSRAGGVDADVEVAFVAVMDDLNDALRGSDPAASSDGSQLEGGARAVGFLWGGRWTDDGDGDDEHFGGDVEAGAFLFGRNESPVPLTCVWQRFCHTLLLVDYLTWLWSAGPLYKACWRLPVFPDAAPLRTLVATRRTWSASGCDRWGRQ